MTDKNTKDTGSKKEVEISVETKIEEKIETGSLIERILSPVQWVRLLFMFLFAVVLCLLSYLIGALVLLQFILVLVTGKDNEKLRHFGNSCSVYIAHILKFLTYNSEKKPFPFDDWPG